MAVHNLATGQPAFHKVIRKILEGLDGCVSILDDILVYGRSKAEHDERLRRMLDRLVQYNATINRGKCFISVPEVEFNGHACLERASSRCHPTSPPS